MDIVVERSGARVYGIRALPANGDCNPTLNFIQRAIPIFINNHLSMSRSNNRSTSKDVLLQFQVKDQKPYLSHSQLVDITRDSQPMMNAADVQQISAVWSALNQLIHIGWVGSEAAQDYLRHIFPEYTVGTSTYGRIELLKKFRQIMFVGSPVWNEVRPVEDDTTPSPINGFYPAVSSVLQLYGRLSAEESNKMIQSIAISSNGLIKVELVAYLLLSLATKAHVKSANEVTEREQIPDHEQRMRHGRPVIYKLGPHTVLSTVVRILIKNLSSSGWTSPWPNEAYGWTLGEPLPRFVSSWQHRQTHDPIAEFEKTFYSAVQLPLDAAQIVSPNWSQLISSPSVTSFKKIRVVDSIEGQITISYPTIKIKPNITRAQLKVVNQLYPYTSATDKNHMTIHLADLIYSLINGGTQYTSQIISYGSSKCLDTIVLGKAGRVARINRILSSMPLGTNNILAMHCLITSMGTKHSLLAYRAFLDLPTLQGTSYEVMQRLKHLSYLARRGQADADGVPCDDRAVSFLAYGELAFGRSGNVTNWVEEYQNRCLNSIHIQAPSPLPVDPTTGKVSWMSDETLLDPTSRLADKYFYDELRKQIKIICAPLVTRRSTTETMDSFLLRRAEWMASGSSGGGTLELSQIQSYVDRQLKRGLPIPNGRVKIAKRAWAETVSRNELLTQFREAKPREAAQASEKFENGKSRAIYGVEPIHYIFNTYATKGFEEKLHLIEGLEKGVTGLRMSQLEHWRALITSSRDQHCSMLDYADFNRHHTPEAQAMIFEVLDELGGEVGACADWRHANRWVAKAKYNMTARIPGYNGDQKVKQGMFSGTKSTDLINTILNLAYFKVANNYVIETYDCAPIDLYHVHQGDDVWLSNRNHVWARLLYYTMHQMGFIFQKSKQMFGEGRGEYLRVLYQNGSASGYLHRALANFILRPLQNDTTQDPISWANTIQDGVATLMRRGLQPSIGRVIWDNAMNYWVKAKSHNLDKCGIRLPREFIELSPECGGLGCPSPGFLTFGKMVTSFPNLGTNPKDLAGVPRHMTDDWIRHVSSFSSRLESLRQIRADALREMSLHTSYSSLPNHVIRADAWPAYKEDVRKWRATQGAKIRRGVKRYRCEDANDLVNAVADYYTVPAFNNPSLPLLHNISQVESNPSTPATEYMNMSKTLNKIVASSRFKSVSATATAYGTSPHQALATILASASEDSSSSQDSRFDIQNVIASNCPESKILLQRPGSSALNALAPFIDNNLLGYCSAQNNQVLAKYMAIFGSDGKQDRLTQSATTLMLTANTIDVNYRRFTRVRY